MKLTIKGKEIELKYTIRAIIIFEKIANKPFQTNSVTDIYLFLYSIILANDTTLNLTFDELINMCDDNPAIIRDFNQFLQDEYKKQTIFDNNETADTQTSKKKV